jgi:hypothetical protein
MDMVCGNDVQLHHYAGMQVSQMTVQLPDKYAYSVIIPQRMTKAYLCACVAG